MLNMSDTKTIVAKKLDTPNGLGIDWIANNIYWSDNEFKVYFEGDGAKTKVPNNIKIKIKVYNM